MTNRQRAGFPVTVHVALRHGGRILLLKRHNTGYRDGWYSLVAGHLEQGERLLEAAAREVFEEVGLKIIEAELRPCGVMHRRSADQRIDFFLVTESWQGSPSNREPEKCAAIGWYSLDQLPSKTIPYIRRALSYDFEGFWWDEYGWEV